MSRTQHLETSRNSNSLPEANRVPVRVSKTQVLQSDWYRTLSLYEKPDHRKAIWQLLNTFVPYAALWVSMIVMMRLGVTYWLILPLIFIEAGLLIRVFIFFHDCCHGSFFASRQANQLVGYLCGILTFTPYKDWQRAHAGHHASAGELDGRGIGDIGTMTVTEYQTASRWKRLGYRLFRNPLVLFLLVPPVIFLIVQRFSKPGGGKRERRSVLWTNLGILGLAIIASLTIGLQTYLLIQVPLMLITGAVGTWLFYVQHQFEGVYWAREEEWDPMRAALEGSSYYKLPKVLQWFTGNIGFHHIHHLRPRIPNYHLQQCYEAIPALQQVEPLTLSQSLKTMSLKLWDESDQKMVSFRALKQKRAEDRRGEN